MHQKHVALQNPFIKHSVRAETIGVFCLATVRVSASYELYVPQEIHIQGVPEKMAQNLQHHIFVV